MSFTNFTYKDSILHVDNVPLPTIIEKYGTPLYVYSLDHILHRIQSFKVAFKNQNAHMHFAIKSNSNQAILCQIAKAGCGMDIVSGGELQRALQAGVSGDKIIFSGVAKTRQEITESLKAGILQFNVESIAELHSINAIALEMECVAPVALRVNPDIDAKTHSKISTGKKTDKFGIDIALAEELYMEMQSMAGIDAQGIAVHIGSQLMSPEPFVEAYKRVVALSQSLKDKGIALQRLDLGGGLGICYDPATDTAPDVQAYADMVYDITKDTGLDVHFEPGRWLVGNAGALIGSVENVKNTDERNFVLCDVGMNDLIRPTLYEAYHHILPVKQPVKNAEQGEMDIVGPVCESGDFMCQKRTMPLLEKGDTFAIMSAGAYGMVQASNYNTRGFPAEVLIANDTDYVIRKRQTISDLIALDDIPQGI